MDLTSLRGSASITESEISVLLRIKAHTTYVAEVEDRFKSADLDLDAFAEAVKSFKSQVMLRTTLTYM